jgi:hypothetical protein
MLFILTNNNTKSECTAEQLVSCMLAKGASVELIPSRAGDFLNVRVNGQPVARAFSSEEARLAWFFNRCA